MNRLRGPKTLKEEIEKCDSLLDSILKSSRECCVYRDADRGTRDLVLSPSQVLYPVHYRWTLREKVPDGAGI